MYLRDNILNIYSFGYPFGVCVDLTRISAYQHAVCVNKTLGTSDGDVQIPTAPRFPSMFSHMCRAIYVHAREYVQYVV